MIKSCLWYTGAAIKAAELISPGAVPDGITAPPPDPDPGFATAAEALKWLSTEQRRAEAACEAALQRGEPDRAWDLAMTLAPLHAQGFLPKGWEAWSRLGVSAAEAVGDPARLAPALTNRGRFLLQRRQLAEAGTQHARALVLYENTGDSAGILRSLNALGLICLRSRMLPEAAERFRQVEDRARRAGDEYWAAVSESNLAESQIEDGDAETALRILMRLPETFASLEHSGEEGNTLWLLSRALQQTGDKAAALGAIDAALKIAADADNPTWEGWWLIQRAWILLDFGRSAEALKDCRKAARLQTRAGDRSRQATALDCAGVALLAEARPSEGADCHREAAELHREFADHWQEGLALGNLAEAEYVLGQEDASRSHLQQALLLLQEFPDYRASRLRVVICDALSARKAE